MVDMRGALHRGLYRECADPPKSNNYAAAKLQGLERDLGLSSVQYQTALSVFYIGYILMQVPSNLLLNYTGRPSLYLGFWVCVWGLVSALTSQVKSFGPLAVCRFILGLSGRLPVDLSHPSSTTFYRLS